MAELELAKIAGCKTAMMSSIPERLRYIEDRGILAIDRRQFPNLSYHEERYRTDPAFKKTYDESEKIFLNLVEKHTEGRGVSIFVDYIGAPVSVATQRALSRQGVLTTAGWKGGMKITNMRALECINRHIHVHTHYARYSDGAPAVALAERAGWLPRIGDKVWSWDEIPALAEDYAADKIADYFPVYQVNSL
jgi:NADPH:quinone reductase-like Zn-dependent oxidoreductase